jgi:integrase
MSFFCLFVACFCRLLPLCVRREAFTRRSEPLSLRWADVDIPHRVVTVQAAYAKDRQTRSIPMDMTLLQTLEALPRAGDP